jgi:Flp pilus assembly CpaE family ATPase
MISKKEKALEFGPLERFFKGSAMARILDFLTVFKEWDYSKSDIAKNSGVNFRTVLRLLPKLEALGVVKKTRNVGKALMYQIDMNNPIAKAVNELAWQITKHDAEKVAKEELAKEEKARIEVTV